MSADQQPDKSADTPVDGKVSPMESSVDVKEKSDPLNCKDDLLLHNGCEAAADAAESSEASKCTNKAEIDAENACDESLSEFCEAKGENETSTKQEMIDFKVVYSKQSFNISFPIDDTVLSLKKHVEELTDVEVVNQKMMFKGLMKDEQTLRELKMCNGAKVMLVGSKRTDIQAVAQQVAVKDTSKSTTASGKEPLCKQKPHKTVLDKYGKPDDVMPGIKNSKESLPPIPLAGMYNKTGSKVRLTFKLETDQLWIGTKERTEKLGLTSIKAVVSEPIEGHEEYHIMGIQLGPTEASRYWVYWVPAQYIDSIKDTILGNWQYF